MIGASFSSVYDRKYYFVLFSSGEVYVEANDPVICFLCSVITILVRCILVMLYFNSTN